MSDFGATGRHPEGRIDPGDEGEIRFGVGAHDGRVVLDFGKPVHSLGMLAEQAEQLAETLKIHADRARRQIEMLTQCSSISMSTRSFGSARACADATVSMRLKPLRCAKSKGLAATIFRN